MINPKNICISACIGFFISFLIGLFSDVHFSVVILRAFLCALGFALLCVGITFLYQKFLSIDTGGFAAESDPVAAKAQSGGVVNIVVGDSSLPDEELAPKFTVLNNHSDLNKNSESLSAASNTFSEEEPSSASPGQPEPLAAGPAPHAERAQDNPAPSVAADNSFKPVSLGQVSHNPEPDAPSARAAAASSDGNSTEQLDELPDISDMQTDSSDVASELDSPGTDEIVSDTEFATGGSKMKEQPISGDTTVMAKAIQTLLAKDN